MLGFYYYYFLNLRLNRKLAFTYKGVSLSCLKNQRGGCTQHQAAGHLGV